MLNAAKYSYARNFTSTHHGTDIMAPEGSPVLAVERGKAWSAIEEKGGKVAYLEGESGTRYFYGHLSAWATKLISATPTSPLDVDVGDELGKVGSTGNAQGKAPHIHFQMRRGSLVIDPFDDLAAVDVNHRGDRNMGKGVLVLALLWAWSQRQRGSS